MLSVRPKVAELAFHVFGRALHPELYTQCKSRRIERTNYEAQVEITSCGHVVTWMSGGVTLCEVATSAHQPLPQKRCILSKPLKGKPYGKVLMPRWSSVPNAFPTGASSSGFVLGGATAVGS